jgi:hypothetical protein
VAIKLITGQGEHKFRRSTYCDSGACVEVALQYDGSIAVRDSKNRSQPELVYTQNEWVAFMRGAKAGEFDFGMNIGSGAART